MLLTIVAIAVFVLVFGVVYAVRIAPRAQRIVVVCVFVGLAGAGYLLGALLAHPGAPPYFPLAAAIGGTMVGFVWVSARRRSWSGPRDARAGLLVSRLRNKHHRKLSNYLLDKSLQLRYVLFVTVLSAVIAGALGYMIYDQRRIASESIEGDLKVLTQADASKDFQDQVTSGLESDDQMLIYKMVAVGLGLVIILSAYLVIMTHKVAGPLYKVSMYFEHMAEGKLGTVTPLRRGDMLQDFFHDFKTTHESLRARAIADAEAIERAVGALRAAHNQADYRGEARRALDDALDALDHHLAHRKQQLG